MANPSFGGGRLWARRVPAVAQGVIGLGLLLALAPSALHLPITGPGGQAEVAPVPGRSNAQVGLSRLGAATSGGVGSAGSAAAANGFTPANPSGTVSQPVRLPCFGNPPAQTEDPLSPPCVSGWSGNNGGATAQGVTGNSIKAVLYVQPWPGGQTPPSGEDYSTDPVQSSDSPFRRTIKTLLRYFQAHFETYGRQVDLVLHVAGPNGDVSDAEDIAQQKPFAVIPELLGNASAGAIRTLAGAHAIYLGSMDAEGDGLPRSLMQQLSPYVWSIQPDLETQEAGTASFICRELVGRPAVHSADPTLQRLTRKLGMIVDDRFTDNSANDAAADALVSDLASDCGYHLTERMSLTSSGEPTTLFTRMQSDGVTTVIVGAGIDHFSLDDAAQTTPPFRPEWIAGPEQADSDQSTEQTLALADARWSQLWNGALTLSWEWRVPALSDTYWYQAYAATNSDGQFDDQRGLQVYEQLMQLFTGIQRAGPRLDPSTWESGLESLVRPAPNVYSPAARYGPGDHSFLHELLFGHWDYAQNAPGASEGPGCNVLPDAGARTAPGDWPDADQGGAAGPCSANFIGAGGAAGTGNAAYQSGTTGDPP